MLYGIEKSAAVGCGSLSGDGILCDCCDLPNIRRSLQLELLFGLLVPLLLLFIQFSSFSVFELFSTVHSLSLNFSQFCSMPFDSNIVSRLFSTIVDVDDELLSLKMTRLEFSIDISDVFCTCSCEFITDFSTTILCDNSTTLCTFSDSVTWEN